MNGNKRTDREPKKLYEDKIISIGKVTKVTQGGRNFRFSATVAVGDRKGNVGIGTGKSKEIPVAVSKAIKEAEKKVEENYDLEDVLELFLMKLLVFVELLKY